MFLVVDANILFSFFNPESSRRLVIKNRSKLGFKLISPDLAFAELLKDKEKIKKYSKIGELEFIILFSLLEKLIESIGKLQYNEFIPKSRELSPHIKDVPYFALALHLNCPIWSDEIAFKKQSKVKVYSTSELVKEVGMEK